MAKAMATSTNAMAFANSQMSAEKIGATTREFAKQSQMMDMKDEMMDQALDGIMGEDDEEVDAAYAEILDSVGIDVSNQLGAVRTGSSKLGVGSSAAKNQQQADDEEDADELMRRLAKLK